MMKGTMKAMMKAMMNVILSNITRPVWGLLLLAAAPVVVTSQSPQARLIGEVIAVDPTKGLEIRADSGITARVRIDDRTRVLKVPAGETSLAKAGQIKASEIAVGDRVLASGASERLPAAGSGQQTAGGSNVELFAVQVVVMSLSEITKMRERESQEWQTRGIAGVVTSVNPQTKEITLLPRGRADAAPIVITTAEATRFRRYAADSVRFSDAKSSSLAEIKRGDHLRALGERSADGARFKSEQIISGSFLTVVGVVSGTTPSGEVKVNVQGIPQPITLRASPESTVKRITSKIAATLVRESSQGSASRNQGSSRGNEVLERLAPMSFSELKQGDVVAFTSAAGRDLSRLTALTVVGGIDLLIAALQKTAGGSAGPALNSGLPAGMLDMVMGQP
ncbi:MAG TPA: hypothetical protein VFV34_06985 [Blastocatellia bacterium]|nr:hypothetical protein [Blastocatellia bacterium]